jgi:hypothetical protein
MKRKYFLKLICVCALISFLVGCSTTPSISDGKKVLENKNKYKGASLIKVVSFHKTNAQKGEFLGVEVYELEFEAEIEYLADVKKDPFGGLVPINEFCFLCTTHKKGERQKIVGSLTFEKTEKGWRGEDGKIY